MVELGQPVEFKAVTEGQNLPPVDEAVLNGIEDIKRTLASNDLEQQLAVLPDALNYGQPGIDLLEQVYERESGQLKWAACSLLDDWYLRQLTEAQHLRAVQEGNLFFAVTCLRTIEAGGAVYSNSISSDGQLMAAVIGKASKFIKIWDLSSNRLVHCLERHRKYFESVVISSKQELIVAGHAQVIIWNLSSRKNVYTLQAHRWVRCVATSLDGERVASGSSDGVCNVWDTSTGKLIHTWYSDEPDWIEAVAFTPDGTRLITAGECSWVRVYDLLNGELIYEKQIEEFAYEVTCIAISPDGQTLFCGGNEDNKTIAILNLTNGELIALLEGRNSDKSGNQYIYSIAISPDGRTLVSGDDNHTIEVWDLQTRRLIRILQGHSGDITSVAITPDGQRIISGSEDGTIKIWGVEDSAGIESG
ncbi:MAG TPA: hypothetical protein DDW76_05545 [Cyanobacteria bacterium UBA11369]|nr:hypothetical protein [Cyanobacteria bacterium UBA11371]HBE36688.1 hypothetical protein [Cyanobacteria bacterium UBA11368]HBE48271.1 hypothetical protein [Cyanobacteria bacterium UBA11369]